MDIFTYAGIGVDACEVGGGTLLSSSDDHILSASPNEHDAINHDLIVPKTVCDVQGACIGKLPKTTSNSSDSAQTYRSYDDLSRPSTIYSIEDVDKESEIPDFNMVDDQAENYIGKLVDKVQGSLENEQSGKLEGDVDNPSLGTHSELLDISQDDKSLTPAFSDDKNSSLDQLYENLRAAEKIDSFLSDDQVSGESSLAKDNTFLPGKENEHMQTNDCTEDSTHDAEKLKPLEDLGDLPGSETFNRSMLADRMSSSEDLSHKNEKAHHLQSSSSIESNSEADRYLLIPDDNSSAAISSKEDRLPVESPTSADNSIYELARSLVNDALMSIHSQAAKEDFELASNEGQHSNSNEVLKVGESISQSRSSSADDIVAKQAESSEPSADPLLLTFGEKESLGAANLDAETASDKVMLSDQELSSGEDSSITEKQDIFPSPQIMTDSGTSYDFGSSGEDAKDCGGGCDTPYTSEKDVKQATGLPPSDATLCPSFNSAHARLSFGGFSGISSEGERRLSFSDVESDDAGEVSETSFVSSKTITDELNETPCSSAETSVIGACYVLETGELTDILPSSKSTHDSSDSSVPTASTSVSDEVFSDNFSHNIGDAISEVSRVEAVHLPSAVDPLSSIIDFGLGHISTAPKPSFTYDLSELDKSPIDKVGLSVRFTDDACAPASDDTARTSSVDLIHEGLNTDISSEENDFNIPASSTASQPSVKYDPSELDKSSSDKVDLSVRFTDDACAPARDDTARTSSVDSLNEGLSTNISSEENDFNVPASSTASQPSVKYDPSELDKSSNDKIDLSVRFTDDACAPASDDTARTSSVDSLHEGLSTNTPSEENDFNVPASSTALKPSFTYDPSELDKSPIDKADLSVRFTDDATALASDDTARTTSSVDPLHEGLVTNTPSEENNFSVPGSVSFEATTDFTSSHGTNELNESNLVSQIVSQAISDSIKFYRQEVSPPAEGSNSGSSNSIYDNLLTEDSSELDEVTILDVEEPSLYQHRQLSAVEELSESEGSISSEQEDTRGFVDTILEEMCSNNNPQDCHVSQSQQASAIDSFEDNSFDDDADISSVDSYNTVIAPGGLVEESEDRLHEIASMTSSITSDVTCISGPELPIISLPLTDSQSAIVQEPTTPRIDSPQRSAMSTPSSEIVVIQKFSNIRDADAISVSSSLAEFEQLESHVAHNKDSPRSSIYGDRLVRKAIDRDQESISSSVLEFEHLEAAIVDNDNHSQLHTYKVLDCSRKAYSNSSLFEFESLEMDAESEEVQREANKVVKHLEELNAKSSSYEPQLDEAKQESLSCNSPVALSTPANSDLPSNFEDITLASALDEFNCDKPYEGCDTSINELAADKPLNQLDKLDSTTNNGCSPSDNKVNLSDEKIVKPEKMCILMNEPVVTQDLAVCEEMEASTDSLVEDKQDKSECMTKSNDSLGNTGKQVLSASTSNNSLLGDTQDEVMVKSIDSIGGERPSIMEKSIDSLSSEAIHKPYLQESPVDPMTESSYQVMVDSVSSETAAETLMTKSSDSLVMPKSSDPMTVSTDSLTLHDSSNADNVSAIYFAEFDANAVVEKEKDQDSMSMSFHQSYPSTSNPFALSKDNGDSDNETRSTTSSRSSHSTRLKEFYESDYRYEPRQKVFTMADVEAEREAKRTQRSSRCQSPASSTGSHNSEGIFVSVVAGLIVSWLVRL